MKRILFLLPFFLCAQFSFAQSRFIRKLFLEKDSSKRSSLLPLPLVAYAQETGLEIGFAALYSFYADTSNHNTKVSNLYFPVSYTFKNQSRISLKTDYWLSGNTYHLTGDIGYSNFPFNFYGIGNNTSAANKDLLVQKRFHLIAGAEKAVFNHVFLGLNLDYEQDAFKDEQPGGIFSTTAIPGKQGGGNLFYGPSLIFDNRNTNTYTLNGLYVNVNGGLISKINRSNYNGGYFNFDFRQFNSLTKKLVLAFNGSYEFTTGSNTPFYLLQTLGNDQLMRGYYGGRFRDRNILALQSELRYRLSDRIAMVVFGGTGTVYNTSFSFNDLKPNYGGGLRYFFDVEKGISIRADYGVGEKPAGEKRQSGFYLSLGEAF
ncbi:BamA/TamA family outer membrane protein [Mucilaginibacter arboris]|uniref:Polymerase n=1 Tax=Mucilaginibacter arboris TaxID=2682090 RepID=A0A7K1SUZ8_9SPHI|nr:hypothetical protein [Mucilaginibacter arboris]MVN21156.1 hypothetical protein [Mucilaginibacter arboris]